jgi:phosphopentomutase
MLQRVVLIVLDGVGVGALPDADRYGDAAAATLPHVAQVAGPLRLPHLEQLGLGRIAPIAGVSGSVPATGCWGKMAEQSPGKDSVTGHWELAGVILEKPFATFPEGFPAPIIQSFSEKTGLEPLGNIAASGTEILRELGEEHLRTGRPIVYTSSDSVFQIAAHEAVIPPEKLYALCRQAEQILQPYHVCRVIARPFVGSDRGNFKRTAGRHDFPQEPVAPTLLDRLQQARIATAGIGKISDLFAGRGLSHCFPTRNNSHGMARTLEALQQINFGLVMTNLVDFDMLYGHRSDARGFAAALEEFDGWLPQLFGRLTDRDLLMITADHGCDPTTAGTDHTREYVPLLVWSKLLVGGGELGVRNSFADVGATIAELFDLPSEHGLSFLHEVEP